MKLKLIAAALLLSLNVLALNPVKEYAITPADFSMNYEDLNIATKDGANLYGWWLKPAKKSGRVVIMNHDGDGNMADLLDLAGKFVSAGNHVILYDYRGFGKSSDFKINKATFIYNEFVKDLEAVILSTKKKSIITEVYLYGEKMGAGLALGATNTTKNIKGVIADSPYESLLKYQEALLKTKGEDIIIPAVYDDNKMDPEASLKDAYAQKKKYLVFVGGQDPICTPKKMKTLFKAAKNTSIKIFKESDGSKNYKMNKSAYYEALKAYFAK